MEAIMEIMNDLDWSPLWISLKTGAAATFISFFLGIYAARKTVKMASGKKAVIDGILTLPMVLPPTVAGFFLLLLFSRILIRIEVLKLCLPNINVTQW